MRYSFLSYRVASHTRTPTGLTNSTISKCSVTGVIARIAEFAALVVIVAVAALTAAAIDVQLYVHLYTAEARTDNMNQQ